jgi:hypothetical protein
MKNHQYIRQMSVEQLAELLIRTEEINEDDEGIGSGWQGFQMTYYITPGGARCYGYDDAVEYTIDWLNAERG